MTKRVTKLVVLALVNAVAYHLAYVHFLHRVFGYADFRYEPTTAAYLIWTYLVAVLPVIAVRKSNSPSAVGAALLYVMSYVPIQLTLTFMWAEKTLDLVLLQGVMTLSMMTFFRAPTSYRHSSEKRATDHSAFFRSGPLTTTIYFLTGISLLLVVTQYHSVMRLTSFEDVYDLRDEASKITVSTVTHYLTMWISYAIGPFFIARAIFCSSKTDWIIGISSLLVLYLAFGSKIALLTPFFMITMRYIDNGQNDFLQRLLATVGILLIFIVFAVPDEGILRYINSLFILRVFGSNGWTGAVYYEYFTSHALTLYTHIGPINAISDAYPYGKNSLGQEIAKHYFSNEANFNAGFWASDGFAALGIAGVPVVTFFLAMFMRALDKLAIIYPTRFINIWLLGFWMGLMNAPFTTALLSGGGLLILLFMWMGKLQQKRGSTGPTTQFVNKNHPSSERG
jgi:hypothetical protein